MTTTQERYVQIEKELLAEDFACERFHQYIYGKTVEVHSDHKPLEKHIKDLFGCGSSYIVENALTLPEA